MKVIDLKLNNLLKNRRDSWIAVSGNFKNIVASGQKLSDLVKKTKNKKENLYYIPVNKKISGFIGKS